MSLPLGSFLILRWLAALLAMTFMGCAGLMMYKALFLLERFGIVAILTAVALWLAATVLWWFVAEGHLPRTRARIRHILIGGILLGVVGLAVPVIGSRRIVDGILMG